jgi:hypothetical protein
MPAPIAATIATFQMAGGSENSPSALIQIEIFGRIPVQGGARRMNMTENDSRSVAFCGAMRECVETASTKTSWLQIQIRKVTLDRS